MPNDLSRAINDAVIRRLAGEAVYERGHGYFVNGQVESLEVDRDSIRALVNGTNDYTVTLSSDEDILDYDCDCPQGQDGAFCKHCVAAALAWLHRKASKKASRKPKQPTLAVAGKLLRDEDHDTVVEMVIGWARDNARLRDSLLQFAARRLGPDSAAGAAGRTFEQAVRVRGFLHYREVPAWARGVGHAIDNFAQLVNDGQGAAAIEVCETALQQLVAAVQSIDDSDGYFSDLRDRLQEIHFQACRQARPDPIPLAKRLFEWELRGDFDVFYGAAETYAKVLGSKGLKEYRRLAEEHWAKVPARKAGDSESDWGSRFRISHIMESLARASGDTEELVSVLSRDLSSGYQYWRIANVYHEAGRHDQALEWAENGIKAFPQRTDPRLREFAAEEYQRRNRHADAMQLIWAGYCDQLYLENYKKLQHYATVAGAWPEWRERALAEIRKRIEKARQQPGGPMRRRWLPPDGDHSRLVEIFLWEGDEKSAWREAREGGCSDALWLQLAEVREKEHPDDAAGVYLKLADESLAQTSNSRYDEPVDLLVKTAAVMKRMDRSTEFVQQLDALRLKYKLKRNFLKLLDENRGRLFLS